jgi:hypothetical protein
VDLAVPLLEVVGLDDYVIPKPLHVRQALQALGAGVPEAGSGPYGTFMGGDFRAAYVPGVALTGEGQKIGLFQLDGYYTNDPVQYAIQAGLTNTIALTTISNVLIGGFDGTPGVNNVEVALDIEMAMSMAPGAQIIVYMATNGGAGVINVLNRMATDNAARQLSASWTYSTGPAMVQAFLQMAGQGQTFFNSSGDRGAYGSTVSGSKEMPYVTLVGGTTLSTAGPLGSWVSETTWNWGNGWCSGGGISVTWAIPNWQQGIDMTGNQGSTTMRNSPDVAMVADSTFAIADNGQPHYLGGTSVAAPLWAGFTALVNQKAAAQGDPPIGFINPALYAIGKGTNANVAFHDITTGNNTNASSPGAFFATPGYDLCTGWGSPTAGLIDDLLNVSIVPGGGWTLTTLPNNDWNGVASSGDGRTLVAVAAGGAPSPYSSTTWGTTWRSSGPSGYWNGVACSSNGLRMAAAAPEGPISLSTNSGDSWSASGSPSYFWTSIACSGDGSKLAAGAFWEGVIMVSTNFGSTWTTAAMPSGRYSPVAWSSDGTVLVVSPGGGTIYVSTNAGITYSTAVVTGFDCRAVAASADGSALVTAGRNAIYVSKNLGQTWAISGAPALDWSSVACSADGYRLAATADGGRVHISDDGGFSWLNTGPGDAELSSLACSADGIRLLAAGWSVYTGFFPRGGPTVQTPPTDQWVVVGSNSVFSVIAIGPPPLSYQWRFNGADIAGATNTSLLLTNVQSSQAGYYDVLVRNSYGTNASPAAFLTVLEPPPVILTHPADTIAIAGHSASFSVAAAGTPPLSYEWQFNGTDIAGATNSLLMLYNVQWTNSGNYAVTVSNQYGSVLSSNAWLTVIPPPACVEPVSGLISWWPAEGNALDRMGTNDGTLAGNTAYGPGLVGQCFAFDGDGDAIALGSRPSLQVQNITIEMWIKRANASLSSQSGGKAYLFAYGSGGYGFGLFDNGALFLEQYNCCYGTAGTVSDTNWHHVALVRWVSPPNTYDTIYVDGIAKGGSAGLGGSPYTNAAIGARADTLANSFYGSIDEPAVYNRVLSSGEIQAICGAGAHGKCGLPEPPYILVPPTNQMALVGGSASFSVAADGRPRPLSYQWTFDGLDIAGATNTSLALTNVKFSQRGNYGVIVTNIHGFATSSATLTVLVTNPPVFDSVGVLSDGTVHGTITGYAGPVAVEASTNLIDWVTVTNLILTSAPAQFSDLSATNYPQRFYRARLE